MTTSMLKIIACLLMLTDHLGATLFPEVTILRFIGRLAFPIFAYLIAIGYSKTASYSKYLSRLLIFALVSQIPFSLAFSKHIYVNSLTNFLQFAVGSPKMYLNIFFTLALGLVAIYIWDKEESKLTKIILVIALGKTASAFNTDYGLYGVAMVLAFYIFRESKIKTLVSQAVVYILFGAMDTLLYINKFPQVHVNPVWFMQGLSLLALILIFIYNPEFDTL